MKEFDDWNRLKKEISSTSGVFNVKEREIYYLNIGKNIGNEQNGKGEYFLRPVIVLKKLNKDIFMGIPTSSKIKQGNFFFYFEFMEKTADGHRLAKDVAILAQTKTFSTKRLLHKIGTISKEDFENMKERLKTLIFDPAPKEAGRPEGN